MAIEVAVNQKIVYGRDGSLMRILRSVRTVLTWTTKNLRNIKVLKFPICQKQVDIT